MKHILVVVKNADRKSFAERIMWDSYQLSEAKGILGDIMFTTVSATSDPEKIKGLDIDGAIYITYPNGLLHVAIEDRLSIADRKRLARCHQGIGRRQSRRTNILRWFLPGLEECHVCGRFCDKKEITEEECVDCRH